MDLEGDNQFENDDISGFNSDDIDADFLIDEYAPKDNNNETIEPIQKVERNNEQNKSLLSFESSLQFGDESQLFTAPQKQSPQTAAKSNATNNNAIDVKNFLQTPVGSTADLDDKSSLAGSRLLIKKTIDKAQDKPKPKVNIFPISLNDSSSLQTSNSTQQLPTTTNNIIKNESNTSSAATASQFTLPGIPVLSKESNTLPQLNEKNNINQKPQANSKTIKVTIKSKYANSALNNSINSNSINESKPNGEVKPTNIPAPINGKNDNKIIKVNFDTPSHVTINPQQLQQPHTQQKQVPQPIHSQPSKQMQLQSNQQTTKTMQSQQEQQVNQPQIQQLQTQNQQQSQVQKQSQQLQAQPQSQLPTQPQSQPSTQPQYQPSTQSQSQLSTQPQSQLPTQSQPQLPTQSQPQLPTQSQPQKTTQPQPQLQLQTQQQPQPQLQVQPELQNLQVQQSQVSQMQPAQQNQQQTQQPQPQMQQLQQPPPQVIYSGIPVQSFNLNQPPIIMSNPPLSNAMQPLPQPLMPQQQPPSSAPIYSYQPFLYNPLVDRVHYSFAAQLDNSFSSIRRSVASELSSVLRNTNASRNVNSYSIFPYSIDIDSFCSNLNSELTSALSFAAPLESASTTTNSNFSKISFNPHLTSAFNSSDYDYNNGFSSVNVNFGPPINVNVDHQINNYQSMVHSYQKEPMLLRPLVQEITNSIDREIKPLSDMMKSSSQKESKAKIENLSILNSLLRQVEGLRTSCKNFGDQIIRDLEREELFIASNRDIEISNGKKNEKKLREMKLQYVEAETKASQQLMELKKNADLFERLRNSQLNYFSRSNAQFLNDRNVRSKMTTQGRSQRSFDDEDNYDFEQILDEINDISNDIKNNGYGQIFDEIKNLEKYLQNDKNSMRNELMDIEYLNQQSLTLAKLNSRKKNMNNYSYLIQNQNQGQAQYNQGFNPNSSINPYSNVNMNMSSQRQVNINTIKQNLPMSHAIDANKRASQYRKQKDILTQSNLA